MYLSAANAEGIYASRAREGDVSRVGRALSLCRLKDGKIIFGKNFVHSCKESDVLFAVFHSHASLGIVDAALAAGDVNCLGDRLDVLAHPVELIGIRKADVRLEFAISGHGVRNGAAADDAAVAGESIVILELFKLDDLVRRVKDRVRALGGTLRAVRLDALDLEGERDRSLADEASLALVAALKIEECNRFKRVVAHISYGLLVACGAADFFIRLKDQLDGARAEAVLVERVHCEERRNSAALAVGNAGAVHLIALDLHRGAAE